MDYSKSGSASAAKMSPKGKRGDQKGAPKPAVLDKGQDKAAMLARMKAAAQKAAKPE